MKLVLIIISLICTIHIGSAQSNLPLHQHADKGKLYFYWGWNRAWYGHSDIKFSGADYDFTLTKVVAKDRQSKFKFETYFNPLKATIPQYNFRVGYYIKNNWDISFGIDHMKYVVQMNQAVNISGEINNTLNYDGQYSGEEILITDDFLKFEHTDGLNYINLELRRSDNLIDLDGIKINFTEGLGFGLLIPRTNTTLLGKERYDEFHLSGYGINSVLGINLSFFNIFFIQPEFKGGFINMQDIRTTNSVVDRASQRFFFTQLNIVFGGLINLNHKHVSKSKHKI